MTTLQNEPRPLLQDEPLDATTASQRDDEAAPESGADRGTREARRYPEPPPPLRADFSRWQLPPVVRPCMYYVISRIAVLFAALGAKWYSPRLHLLQAMTTGWDAKWYTLIAQHGYPHHIINEGHGSRWAFFPAWPFTIRATVAVTHLSYVNATLFLSFALGLASAIAVWLTVREVFGTVIADRASLLYVFFPTAYVLSLGYSEALFITACGICLFALSRRYWLTAASAACVGGLTRNFGVVLIACVVVAAGHAVLTTRRVRPLLAVLIAPLGFVGWVLYAWHTVGTPFAFVQAERFWGNAHFVWFVTPFLAVFDMFTGPAALKAGQAVICALAVVFAYTGIVLLAKARDRGVSIPLFWWVFTIASTFAVLSSYQPDSVLRYSMAIVTVYAAYAWRMRPSWEGPVVGILAVGQGMFMLIALVGSQYPLTTPLWP